MQDHVLLVRLSHMSEDQVEGALCERGQQLQYAPWGHLSPWADAVIPYIALIGSNIPGSMSARLTWAEWTAEFEGRPYDLRRVIDVTAWRLREIGLFRASLELLEP